MPAFLLLAANVIPVSAQNITVKAYINQSFVVVNQAVELAVELSGTGMNQGSQPILPDLGDWFSYTGTQGSSQSTSIVYGKVSFSTTYTFGILPLKEGKTTIPSVTVRVGNSEFKSVPVSVEIKPAGSSPAPRSTRPNPLSGGRGSGDPVDLFIVAIPDKKSVYQYEGITVEYKVYFGPGVSIQEYTPLNTPHAAGFWTEEYPISSSPRAVPEVYNGKQYNAAVLKQVELFPTSSGEFEIDPVRMQFKVRLPQRSRGSIFDDFFNNSLFGTLRDVTVSSGSLIITSKPLPVRERPAGFKSEVGSYTIDAVLDKSKVKEHDSITLKVTISGTGNIKLINEPDIYVPDTFERYEPKIEEKINRSGGVISGEKTFEYVMIPRVEGSYTIEPVTLAFFDTNDERYKVVATSPIPIVVEPGDAGIARSARNLTREEVRLVGQDVRFIKESVVQWYSIGEGKLLTLPFLALLFTPVLLMALSIVYSKHLRKLNADLGYKRNRQANAVAIRRLKTAKTFLEKEDSDSYYPEIARTLQEYIADKLNIAAAGIVTDTLETMLKDKQVDNDILISYIACLKACDLYRFASVKSTGAQMKELYENSKKVISDMEERLKNAA